LLFRDAFLLHLNDGQHAILLLLLLRKLLLLQQLLLLKLLLLLGQLGLCHVHAVSRGRHGAGRRGLWLLWRSNGFDGSSLSVIDRGNDGGA
jgi:hypothetical protein